MIFDVVRTSDWGFNENHKPCKNARIHTFEKEIKTYIFDPDDGHKIEQTKGVHRKCGAYVSPAGWIPAFSV